MLWAAMAIYEHLFISDEENVFSSSFTWASESKYQSKKAAIFE